MVLTLTMSDEGWLVTDIDFESEEGAEDELKRFREANPKSIDLPPLTRNSSVPQDPLVGKAEVKDMLAAEKAFQQLQSTRVNDELDPRQALTSKYLAFEEKHRGTPAAIKALTQVMRFAGSVADPTCAAAKGRVEAVDRLMNHYLRHDGIEKTIDALLHPQLFMPVNDDSSGPLPI
jgi:hypothetical protein